MSKSEQPNFAARSWLLAFLIVASAAGLLALLRSGDGPGDTPAAKSAGAAGVEEVEEIPIVPHGEITSASWRVGDAQPAAAPAPAPASLLDDHKTDEDRLFEESLQETIAPLEGMAVYVEKPKKENR